MADFVIVCSRCGEREAVDYESAKEAEAGERVCDASVGGSLCDALMRPSVPADDVIVRDYLDALDPAHISDGIVVHNDDGSVFYTDRAIVAAVIAAVRPEASDG